MQSKDRIRVQHILDEANEACKYAEIISSNEFVEDGKTVRAVIRSIEVICKAASKISIELHPANSILSTARHPEKPSSSSSSSLPERSTSVSPGKTDKSTKPAVSILKIFTSLRILCALEHPSGARSALIQQRSNTAGPARFLQTSCRALSYPWFHHTSLPLKNNQRFQERNNRYIW